MRSVETLPVKLGREPLVDALVEVWFDVAIPLNVTLPGVLLKKYEGAGVDTEVVSRLRHPRGLPVPEPQMTVRFTLPEHFIIVGSRTVAVASRIPYVGWSNLKSKVLEILALVFETQNIQGVARYSMKYVNVLEKIGEIEPARLIDWDLRIGAGNFGLGTVQFQTEYVSEGITTKLHIVTGATAEGPGLAKTGVLIDVDTLVIDTFRDVGQFFSELPGRLDTLRLFNKRVFFSAITNEGVASMDPSYGEST